MWVDAPGKKNALNHANWLKKLQFFFASEEAQPLSPQVLKFCKPLMLAPPLLKNPGSAPAGESTLQVSLWAQTMNWKPISHLESLDSSPLVLNLKQAFKQVICKKKKKKKKSKNTFVSLPMSIANFEVDWQIWKFIATESSLRLKSSVHSLQECTTTWLHLLKVLIQTRFSCQALIELTLI